MVNNKLMYLGGIIFIFIMIGGIVGLGSISGNTAKSSSSVQTNPELDKYRIKDIPEDCRIPIYENNLMKWKEHLSHHQNTGYCLEYYGTNIDELKGGIKNG